LLSTLKSREYSLASSGRPDEHRERGRPIISPSDPTSQVRIVQTSQSPVRAIQTAYSPKRTPKQKHFLATIEPNSTKKSETRPNLEVETGVTKVYSKFVNARRF